MDLSTVSKAILYSNLHTYSRQTGPVVEQRVAAIHAELARRQERKSHRGATAGYVLTHTGQYEHKAGPREGYTKCGRPISNSRTYGRREWWHCLSCGE